MKRWRWAVSAVGVMIFSAAVAAPVVPVIEKVAFINLTEVVEQLPQHQQVVRQLQSKFSAGASELQVMEQNIAEKLKKLQRDAAIMQRSEQAILEKEVADLREQFVTKAQKFEQQSRQQQVEAQNQLLKQIRQAAEVVAKQRGYTVVLDASAVIYAGMYKDITKEVVRTLKK